MSSNTDPVCPKCRRRIAAWKLNHCVYCGEVFPADWKAGLPEPEALKWVDRPEIPADAAKKLEMMKIVPMDGKKPGGGFVGFLASPTFKVAFYVILLGGAAFLGWVAWTVFQRVH